MTKKNLHPCYCVWCQRDTDTILDMGTSDRVHQCGNCNNNYTGAVWPGRCPVCNARPGVQVYITQLAMGERVPGPPCSECNEKQLKLDEEVAAGGVRFQCTGCGSDGVFSAVTDFAKKVREENNTPAPNDIRIQIKVCPQCETKNDESEGDAYVQSFDIEAIDEAIKHEAEVDATVAAIATAAAEIPETPVDCDSLLGD